ncbi:Anaphase-promoting complex subunit 2 [Vitis vinifera]|uniref:Anaphase-promoting complex subunit 2 n=1 Tax=Vitis vinifera TaxID=29760 RepID=A0A438D9B9_VITVI|nr:Anaphase-promoting complex subunit 2 [Vitis vinifera]
MEAASSVSDLGILDSVDDASITEIMESWDGFCRATEALLNGHGDLSVGSEFVSHVHSLCKRSLGSLVQDHFLRSLEETFERNGATRFWRHFDAYTHVEVMEMSKSPVRMHGILEFWCFCHVSHECEMQIQENGIQKVLYKALDDVSLEKQYQEKCLLMLVHALQSYKDSISEERHNSDAERIHLFSKYQLIVSSVLMTTLPRHFPEILHCYFKGRLEELSTIMAGEYEDDNESDDKDDMDLDEKNKVSYRGEMDIDECYQRRKFLENNKLVKNIGKVVRDLRNLGFTSMAEDAYASAIFLLLKDKVHNLAGDDYRSSVLESIKEWIQAVPLQFLYALLAYLGDSVSYDNPSSGLKSPLASHPSSCYPGIDTPSEGLIRWQLRLEYFAYETLQDLRIAKLFEIIVDYPDSSPAIEDLKQCLEYTGQHSKLVDSFISALRYRLLTAGASTNDILHQYVSTIKALRTIDPAGVFLEAVGEPIRDYLRGRKDTIKCIVTMLTDGTGGNPNGPGNTGDSLLEELNRDEENQENAGIDDDFNIDEKQDWINAERWEPDPVEADPSKGSRNRRKVDILGMIVGIIGSKDQLVNEYRVMLAEKLLNKSDYDIDSEIRTLELLKADTFWGEQHAEVFFKASFAILLYQLALGSSLAIICKMLSFLLFKKFCASVLVMFMFIGSELGETGVSLDILDATIISSNFWPPIQDEALNIPGPVDQLLADYAKRFHKIKTPRKLLWKKNLGTVKLELQFEGRVVQFTVAPLHAAIIMQFQDQTSWTSKNLAASIGVPVDVLNRRINFWISKGILSESLVTDPNDHIFTLVDDMVEPGKNSVNAGSCEELLVCDEEGERSVASVEDQLHKEMIVYEKFIMGMLTNFGSMALDRIHNTLKMFCLADPPYDKSLQQLQSFLSGLVSEEKLEIRDGMYFLKK